MLGTGLASRIFSGKVRKYRQAMHEARTYNAWREAALELDYIEENVDWKEDFYSRDYNYNLIYERLRTLRTCHEKNDMELLVRSLREGFHHDLGNIGNWQLYARCHVGTKHLIEEYITQVCNSLNYLCDTEIKSLSHNKKVRFFREAALSFGKPALLLSGGATLGLFHAGVVKALWERGLLPQVISGSSAGSIMAGTLGVHTDAEIPELLNVDESNFQAWRWMGVASGLGGKGFMDPAKLEECIQANIGDYTFEEAYDRTGRSINISVSPVNSDQERSRLLSGYTSPYMLIRSAVVASCSVPLVFPPAQLLMKHRSGEVRDYMPGVKWMDGSVVSDLPMDRLIHLYDVNFSIVSQANPHIAPLLKQFQKNPGLDLLSLPSKFIKAELGFHGRWLFDYLRQHGGPEAVRQTMGHMYAILSQKYYGDVTIAPRYGLYHLRNTVRNPTIELVRELMLEGERVTWPRLAMINTHAKISKTLENCNKRLKQRSELKKRDPGQFSTR